MRIRATMSVLLMLATPAAAQAEPIRGTYVSDRAGMEQKAIIKPDGKGGYSVRLSVSAERCVGKLEAAGRMQGGALIASPAKRDDACRITVRKTAKGIEVDEDKCLYWHGAACEFSGPYAAR